MHVNVISFRKGFDFLAADLVGRARRSVLNRRQRRHYFKGDVLERYEGDEMPTESEFVASLETRKGKGDVPVLEATEQQLARYPQPGAGNKEQASPAAGPAAAPGRSYPPLEPTAR